MEPRQNLWPCGMRGQPMSGLQVDLPAWQTADAGRRLTPRRSSSGIGALGEVKFYSAARRVTQLTNKFTKLSYPPILPSETVRMACVAVSLRSGLTTTLSERPSAAGRVRYCSTCILMEIL